MTIDSTMTPTATGVSDAVELLLARARSWPPLTAAEEVRLARRTDTPW